MYADSTRTTKLSRQNGKQKLRVPKSLKKRRVGLVALRQDKPDSVVASVGDEKKRRMIELTAYYKAEQRGFVPGGELQDWLAAEQEVNAGDRTHPK